MEEALIARLLADAALAALVTPESITWSRRDQGGSLPAVVLHRIGGLPDMTMAGPSGLVESRVQIDCWAEDRDDTDNGYSLSVQVGRAVLACLNGAAWTANPVRIDGVFAAGQRQDDFDEGGRAVHRTSIDFIIHHATA